MRIISLLFAASLLAGCASFSGNADKTLTSIALVTDAAMQGWAAYVAAGHSNPAQEEKAKEAYAAYQIAFNLAQALVKAGNQTAAQNALNDLTAKSANLSTTLSTLQQHPAQ